MLNEQACSGSRIAARSRDTSCCAVSSARVYRPVECTVADNDLFVPVFRQVDLADYAAARAAVYRDRCSGSDIFDRCGRARLVKRDTAYGSSRIFPFYRPGDQDVGDRQAAPALKSGAAYQRAGNGARRYPFPRKFLLCFQHRSGGQSFREIAR